MKAWELMEQLQGRDLSGQITVHLEGNDRCTTDIELSPPSQREIEIGVPLPYEELAELEQNVEILESMVDDLQSALQKISHAFIKGGAPLTQAIEDAKEISTREKP